MYSDSAGLASPPLRPYWQKKLESQAALYELKPQAAPDGNGGGKPPSPPTITAFHDPNDDPYNIRRLLMSLHTDSIDQRASATYTPAATRAEKVFSAAVLVISGITIGTAIILQILKLSAALTTTQSFRTN